MADDMITLGLNYGERECVDCIYVGLCRYIHMDKEQPCVFRKTDDFVPYGKLLDAEALKSHYSWLCEDAKLTKKDIDDIVDAQPSVDAVQVVRCLDCRWWKRKYANVGKCEKLADRDQEGGAQFDCDMDDDDFCSYGERKEATQCTTN